MSKTALIFLHGSGGSGIELRTYLESFRIEAFNYKTFRQITDENNMDIYCPTSKSIEYLPAFGHPMNVWFNRSLNFTNLGLNDTYEDTVEIQESINRIKKLINDIYDKYDYIVLGGFSMGGGLTLYFTRETLPDKVIGIFSISSKYTRLSLKF
jgi:predicted esterase